MTTIMLHSIDQVDPDILLVLRYISVLSLVTETLLVLELLKFQLREVLPPCVAILFIKLESLSIVSWDLESKHILR